MTDEFEDEYETEDGYERPELDPPDPNVEDPRPTKKRRRRAPSAESSATTAKPTKSAKPKPEDWGFEDEEEESSIAEWKLGLVLVVVLIAGFGVVAWRKYDVGSKLKELKGDAVIAKGDMEANADGPDDALLKKVELDPPAEPRPDLADVLPKDSSLADGANAFLSSFDSETPTRTASNTAPVPAPIDPGWGATTKPVEKEPVTFDFGPQNEPRTREPNPEVAGNPFDVADTFADVTQPAEPMPATTLASEPLPTESLPVDPFAIEPLPTKKPEPTPVVETTPFDLDPFAPPAKPVEKSIPEPVEPLVADTQPATDPFALDIPPVTETPVQTLPEMQPAASPNPFQLDPVETVDVSPRRDPVNTLPQEPANDPFMIEPLPATVDPLPAVTETRPATPPMNVSPLEPMTPAAPPMTVVETPFTTPAPRPRQPEPSIGPTRVDTAIDTRRHTVDQGESYWTISKQKYGTVKYFAALAEWNKKTVADPRHLRAGMTIELPPADLLEPLVKSANLPTVSPRSANPMATLRPEAHTARRHKVATGENYWTISKSQYGTSRYFAALAEWNKKSVPDARKLRAGTVIELPPAKDLEPLVTTASPNGPAPSKGTDTGANGYFETASGEPRYRVGANETLSGIAQKTLGYASRWRQLYGLNDNVIASPDRLPEGVVLRLPPDATQIARNNR